MTIKARRLTAVVLTMALIVSSLWVGSIDAYAEDVAITGVELSTDNLPAIGGEVKVSVTGTGLTADNWDIGVKVVIEDTTMTPGKLSPHEIKDKTATGATLVVPCNQMRNNLTYTLTVTAGTSSVVKTLTLAKKDYYIDSTLTSTGVYEDVENNSVRILFDQSITPRGSVENLKSYFYLLDISKKALENDVVDLTFEDKAIVVTFENPVNVEACYIGIAEGALKIGEQNGYDISNTVVDNWLINRKPSVSDIKLDNTMLTNKGGKVVATLEGYRVEAVQDSDIQAGILKAGQSSQTNIEVIKGRDENNKPTLTFELPENTGDKTNVYILKVIVGTKQIYESLEGRTGGYTVSVLAPGTTADQQTLGAMTVAAMTDAGDGNLTSAVANVPDTVGQLKTEVRLYGTNLVSKVTRIRAIDEEGIIWPVYDVAECDGVWRFIAIAGPNRNGIYGNGNAQLIELLPPRYAGTNKTYTIQASIDGENWIEGTTVTLTVNNANIKHESEFRECNKDTFKTVTVSYVDTDGKKIAEDDVYTGYEISMVQQFNIAPKEIKGYTLKTAAEPENDEWVGPDGRAYEYVYSKEETVPTPSGEAIKSVALSASSYYYNGKAKAPKITVKNAAGTVLINGTDYTVIGPTSAIRPGTYTVTVVGAGKYNGSLKKAYKIVVKPTKISKIVSGKKSFKVTAGKLTSAYASGYQVKYSRYSSMKKAKTATIGAKYNRNTKSVTKLAAKKKYYVQVRAYKTIGGKKYYSAWSAKKSVKTK